MATRTVTRMFERYATASSAVSALEAAGFRHAEISLIASGLNRARDANRDGADDRPETGAGTGATLGAAVGGGAGILAGIGALAVPGLGPIVAAGWLIATLTGAGVGAAAGGLLGALTGAGVDEADAHVYAEGVRRGGSLVSVRAESEARAAEAEAILERHGAMDPRQLSADWRASGWSGRYADDDSLIPSSPDGTPGNPPGTMASRAADRALGTNMSGAYPGQSDGTSANPPGTAATRAASGLTGDRAQLTPRADDDGRIIPRQPDGAPGNPPGTELSRGADEVLGTNISGAHPENERRR